DPKPDMSGIEQMPPLQLYDLSKDPGGTENVYLLFPEKVEEMEDLMVSYIENGRSTPGVKQENAIFNLQGQPWHQIAPILSE
ncbi:MAG: arylsulfatase, partial [Pricia sp.]|nr:arylsulfatase [Pricia sp.]